MSLEEREQRLEAMELAAAERFQQQQADIARREAELDGRESAIAKREVFLREREEGLDRHTVGQEQAFRNQEEQMKVREERIRSSEQRLANNRAEFEANTHDISDRAAMTPPDTPRGRTSPDDIKTIRDLEGALSKQDTQFQTQLAAALAKQSAEFDAKLQAALAEQASKFQAQLKESEQRAGASSQEAGSLRQELHDKADEYNALEAREAALQAEAIRIQEVADEARRDIEKLMEYDVVNASDFAGAPTISEEKKRSWIDTLYSAGTAVSAAAKNIGKAVSNAVVTTAPAKPAAAAQVSESVIPVVNAPLSEEARDNLADALDDKKVIGPHTAAWAKANPTGVNKGKGQG